MDSDEIADQDVTRVGALATRAFLKIEVFAYVVLGIMLALTALLGIYTAGVTLLKAVQAYGAASSLVSTIDRLLFVLMVVEILQCVSRSAPAGWCPNRS